MRQKLIGILLIFNIIFAGSCASAKARINPKMHRYANGWFAGEQGNLCLARFDKPDGASLTIAMTRWDDLSDHLLFWSPDLPPLWSEPDDGLNTGLSEAEEVAEAEASFHLEYRIDGKTGPMFPNHRMMVDYLGRPGPTYALSIEQAPMIAMLASARRISVHRSDKLLGEFIVAPGKEIVSMLRACVAKRPL